MAFPKHEHACTHNETHTHTLFLLYSLLSTTYYCITHNKFKKIVLCIFLLPTTSRHTKIQAHRGNDFRLLCSQMHRLCWKSSWGQDRHSINIYRVNGPILSPKCDFIASFIKSSFNFTWCLIFTFRASHGTINFDKVSNKETVLKKRLHLSTSRDNGGWRSASR